MKLILMLPLILGQLVAEDTREQATKTPAPAGDPPAAIVPEVKPAEDPALLFIKGRNIGNVGDSPKGAYRRLVQRTIMPTEPHPEYGAILTFDDQLIPLSEGDSSALEVANDLKKVHARAIFFANIPQNSTRTLSSLLNTRDPEASTRQALLKRKPAFMKAVRDLLKIKDEDRYVCEVYNHTAFHQDMKHMKTGTSRYKICLLEIRFIEECLDEAYAAERPGYVRARYFRFPFLHAPVYATTRKDLDRVFTELGLIALGETQDSKDVLNFSADLAYEALTAAKNHQCYTPTLKAHGETEQPIALFHTRSWSRIKSGILKAINEKPLPAESPKEEELANPASE